MLRVLLDVILPVFAVAAVGGVAGRRLGLQVETFQSAVFFIFSPALVFVGLSNLDVAPGAIGRITLVAITVFAVNAVIALVWSRARGHDPARRAAMAISAATPNQGNMGLPVASLAFGAAGLEIGTLLFAIGIVMNATCGITLGTLALGAHTRRREVLYAPFRYPAVYAAVAGALVNVTNVDLPAVIDESTRTLGDAAIPVMLVILGLSFRAPTRADLTDPLAASVDRLLVGPVVAWIVAEAVGLDGVAGDVTILMAAMPAAVNTTILAAQLRANAALAVNVVVTSTGLSLLSLAVLLTFFL